MTDLPTLSEQASSSVDVERPASVVRAAISPLVWTAVGVGAGLLILVGGLLDWTGVGSVERIVSLGRRAESRSLESAAVFLGDSITREGIDARAVEAASPDWRAENLATSGAGLPEFRIQLPKLLAAMPGAVVIGLRPEHLGPVNDIDVNKAYAYAMGGFPTAWPDNWRPADFPELSPETWQALHSTPLEQKLHFRTAPLDVFNDAARLKMRRGELRPAQIDNWIDPFEMTSSINDDRLEGHLQGVAETVRSAFDSGKRRGAEEVRALVQLVRESGASPVLVMLPMHPVHVAQFGAEIDALRGFVDELAAAAGTTAIDASALLTANEFADAVHPNAAGREKFSRYVGQHLPPALSRE